MTPIIGALTGAIIMLVAVSVVLTIHRMVARSWELALRVIESVDRADLNTRKLNVSMSAVVGHLAKIRGSLANLEVIAQELQYMRELTQNAVQEQGELGQTPSEAPAAPGAVAPRRVGFPSPIYDRFPVAEPDAAAEDTDMDLLEQTDDQLAEIEKIENLRSMGIEVEPDDTVHPGVEMESQ